MTDPIVRSEWKNSGGVDHSSAPIQLKEAGAALIAVKRHLILGDNMSLALGVSGYLAGG